MTYYNFENVKEGDQFVVVNRRGEPVEVTVTRVTKTQFVVSNSFKYRKTNGSRIGHSDWDTTRLLPADSEEAKRLVSCRRLEEELKRLQDALNRFSQTLQQTTRVPMSLARVDLAYSKFHELASQWEESSRESA